MRLWLMLKNHYIDTAIELARQSECTYLTVDYLEGKTKDKDIVQWSERRSLRYNLSKSSKKIRQGLRIPVSDCANYLRLCLRECFFMLMSMNIAHDVELTTNYYKPK